MRWLDLALLLSVIIARSAAETTISLSPEGSFSCSDLKPHKEVCAVKACMVDLVNRSLDSVPPLGKLDCARDVKILFLMRNKITELHEDDFHKLINLQAMVLTDNQIGALPLGVFSQQNSLEILNLVNNNIGPLTMGVFDPLMQLEQLALGSNHLAELTPGIFDRLKSLHQLDLMNNQITKLPAGVFQSLKALEYLWLSRNQLDHVAEGIFDDFENLQGLYMRVRAGTALPDGLFDTLTEVQDLMLDNGIDEGEKIKKCSGRGKCKKLIASGKLYKKVDPIRPSRDVERLSAAMEKITESLPDPEDTETEESAPQEL